MKKEIIINNEKFKLFWKKKNSKELNNSEKINHDYKNKTPIFIGALMVRSYFSQTCFREISIDCEN